MPYSITREDGTADAMALQDALNVIKKSSSWDSPTAARLRELRNSIEQQVTPTPAQQLADQVDCITRDAIDAALDDPPRASTAARTAHRAVLRLMEASPLGATNPSMVDPQTANEVDRTGWRDGFDRGTKNTRERIYNRLTALKDKLITAPEKTAIDKALAEIEADAADNEGSVYHS